ncbi:MAG: BTAD domain-containing putative transcriptional regulator [bacterium]
MLSLYTLGGTHVTADSGAALSGAASQKRVLSLLAILAIAGEAGLSRDKLIGVLWPEAEDERARHSLTQTLYVARRALGAEDLFILSPTSVRLNFGVLTCDVCAFEAELDAGELEAAVARYGGPFLDGFFLGSSAEFERWSASHRERLEARLAQSLGELASRAEAASEYARAVEWRRKLAALRPLDAAAVVRLMSALAGSGDRAGAIQQARLHAALLHHELELDPDPVVEALAARLRTDVSWEPSDSSAPASDTTPEVNVSDTAILPAIDERQPLHDEARMVPAQSSLGVARAIPELVLPLWVRWAVLSVVVLVLIGSGVLIGRARRAPTSQVHQLAVRQRVVVAPFRVAGASPSLGYLRDGVVELLSTRLADDSAARSIDAGAVLGAWRAAGLAPAMDVPRDAVVKLAERLGAERVVVGSAVGTPAHIILRAEVLVVPSGSVSAEASISGPVDSLTTLIDRLAGQLLAAEAGEDAQLALQTTRSLPALRDFLAGQAALRKLDYTAALRQYNAALARDSGFALAALQAATMADRLLDVAQLRRSLAVAWAHRDALNERDRLRLDTYVAAPFSAPASQLQQWSAWQRMIELAGSDADLGFALGWRILHDGALAGVADPRARTVEALRRSTLSDAHPPTRGLLASMGVVAIDSNPSVAMLGPLAPFVRWRAAIARSDTVARVHIRDTIFRLGPANLRAIALSSQYDGVATADGALATEYLAARATRLAERVDAMLAEHAGAVLHGRTGAALDVISRLERAQPGSFAAQRLRVLDALYGDGDSAVAVAAARELAVASGIGVRGSPAAALTSSESRDANLCVVGQWFSARGDSASARRAAVALRSRRGLAVAAVSASPAVCASMLNAALAVGARARDARSQLLHLDSLVLSPQVVGDLSTYAPLLLARLHERLGDVPGALAAVRRRAYMMDWPRYLAVMLREEARLSERAGDFPGMQRALEHYHSYREPAAETESPAPR